ncbi:MAG: RidA family protein, partial [Chloroflexi bacterium]|nr:RidA family protein [Chloroflexota bacterium]
MSSRQSISSNTPWESIAGFSRAVRVGDMLFVSGTTASDEQGNTVHANDAAAQARAVLAKIQTALQEAGAPLS